MPVFDYRCNDCGKTYDVYHKVREIAEDVVCPNCDSMNSKKLMSVPAAAVSGRSSTDYAPASSCDSGGGCCGGACGLN